ncbi:MAG: Crp/Fnr family transcriptional regulator [Anaerolineales bacterium]
MGKSGLELQHDEKILLRWTTGPRAVTMDALERVKFLRTIPLFGDLDEDLLSFLASESCERSFEAGELLFYQGDPGTTCYIITEGRVRIFLVGEDGRELSMRIMGPGEIFGEMALFEDEPRSANIEALGEVKVLELHRETFLRCLLHSPTLALRLLRSLSARLRMTTEAAENLVSLTVAERLMLQLQRLAERSGRAVEGGTQIMLPLTQRELAALVGTSRESVNRALVCLRREGKVRLEGGWIVLLEP